MITELDFYFPYLVFFYGTIMTLVTHMPFLAKQAEPSFSPELLQWFYGHRVLGLVCLCVGGLWSVQRILQ